MGDPVFLLAHLAGNMQEGVTVLLRGIISEIWYYDTRSLSGLALFDQQPRRRAARYVGYDRYGFYAGLIPITYKIYIASNRPRGFARQQGAAGRGY